MRARSTRVGTRGGRALRRGWLRTRTDVASSWLFHCCSSAITRSTRLFTTHSPKYLHHHWGGPRTNFVTAFNSTLLYDFPYESHESAHFSTHTHTQQLRAMTRPRTHTHPPSHHRMGSWGDRIASHRIFSTSKPSCLTFIIYTNITHRPS